MDLISCITTSTQRSWVINDSLKAKPVTELPSEQEYRGELLEVSTGQDAQNTPPFLPAMQFPGYYTPSAQSSTKHPCSIR